MKCEITLRRFIEETFLNDYQQILGENVESNGYSHPYLSFALISIGIEFLGKCLSSNGWQNRNTSTYDINSAISTFPSLNKYNDIKDIIRDQLRNSMCHALLPKQNLVLSNGHHNHIRQGEITTIFVGALYQDFKEACKELLNNDNIPHGKDLDRAFLYVEDHEYDNQEFSLSACTETILEQII